MDGRGGASARTRLSYVQYAQLGPRLIFHEPSVTPDGKVRHNVRDRRLRRAGPAVKLALKFSCSRPPGLARCVVRDGTRWTAGNVPVRARRTETGRYGRRPTIRRMMRFHATSTGREQGRRDEQRRSRAPGCTAGTRDGEHSLTAPSQRGPASDSRRREPSHGPGIGHRVNSTTVMQNASASPVAQDSHPLRNGAPCRP